MPRIVPSQAIDIIDKLFPKYRDQRPGERRYLTADNDSQLVAMLEVIQQVPSELINLAHDDYVEFISSVAAVRHMIDVWKMDQKASFCNIEGLRPLSPVALIRQALAKCSDEFPSNSRSELTFISDDDLR
jgi:hypothetical protein